MTMTRSLAHKYELKSVGLRKLNNRSWVSQEELSISLSLIVMVAGVEG